MTRDEEEELILEALEARAEKMRKNERASYQEQLAKELLSERAKKEKSKRNTSKAVAVVLLLAVFFGFLSDEHHREKVAAIQKKVDNKIANMHTIEILRYATNLYAKDHYSDELNYLKSKIPLECVSIGNMHTCTDATGEYTRKIDAVDIETLPMTEQERLDYTTNRYNSEGVSDEVFYMMERYGISCNGNQCWYKQG